MSDLNDEDQAMHDAMSAVVGLNKAFVIITTDMVGDIIGGELSIVSNVSKEDYLFMLSHVMRGTPYDERGPMQ